MQVYLIGSLRNPQVPVVGNRMRKAGFDVFDDWFSAGPDADDCWQRYETARGRTYKQALAGAAAINVFRFDRRNIEASDAVVLVLPAGKSAHLELGWALGKGIPGYILLPEKVDRYDVMYQFPTDIFETVDEMIDHLKVGLSGTDS